MRDSFFTKYFIFIEEFLTTNITYALQVIFKFNNRNIQNPNFKFYENTFLYTSSLYNNVYVLQCIGMFVHFAE